MRWISYNRQAQTRRYFAVAKLVKERIVRIFQRLYGREAEACKWGTAAPFAVRRRAGGSILMGAGSSTS